MLKEFRIKNFRSINEEQTFTMEACPDSVVSEFPEHVIHYKGESLLRVSSMYGPNGGGKSTLIHAIRTVVAVVSNIPLLCDDDDDKTNIPSVFCKSNDSSFEMFVITTNYEIGYSLIVDLSRAKEGNNREFYHYRKKEIDINIKHEELVYRKLDSKDYITLFERDSKGTVKSDLLKELDFLKNNLNLSSSNTFLKYIVSTFSKISNEYLQPVFEFASNIYSFVVFPEHDIIDYRLDENYVKAIKPHFPFVVKTLNSLDFRIKDLICKRNKKGELSLFVVRETNNGGDTHIPYSLESKGTKKVINILLHVYLSSNQSIFLADDFDSHLHPKLIRAIIDLFSNKEFGQRQLILNSHDFINMDNQVFRRDEIWFAYRGDNYSTIYTPLSNIVDYKNRMVRKDAKYGKQYLEGRYGADPFIEKGLRWSND